MAALCTLFPNVLLWFSAIYINYQSHTAADAPGGLTYLLHRVLLEKLTGLQLVKKFHAFHRTRRFITALTSVRHLSPSWVWPIQSIYPHPTSWRSILILSTHLRLGIPSGLFPCGFPTKTLYTPLSSPIRATCPAHLILLNFITRYIIRINHLCVSSTYIQIFLLILVNKFSNPHSSNKCSFYHLKMRYSNEFSHTCNGMYSSTAASNIHDRQKKS